MQVPGNSKVENFIIEFNWWKNEFSLARSNDWTQIQVNQSSKLSKDIMMIIFVAKARRVEHFSVECVRKIAES